MYNEDTTTDALKKSWTVIGLMSGTSLDGLDIARAKFELTSQSDWVGELINFKCYDYPDELRGRLRSSMELGSLDLKYLERDWSRFAAEKVLELKEDSDLLCSHGHTVFHKPEDGITLQIGSGSILASLTGLPTVCDLRSQDVSLGGTGAPLIPVVDRMLFSEYSACVNLGGFSNISLSNDDSTIAWDIGPCNNLLNLLAREVGLDFDKDGKMAQEGLISDGLLDDLLKLEYHNLKPPKSLGMEWFYNEMLPVLIAHKGLSLENMMCTSVDYIATTIVADLPVGSTLFSGGGARNKYLIRRILKMVDGTDRKIIISEAPMLDAKEAYGFAFLGLLRWLLMDNVLNSVTGASRSTSSGAIYLP
ncbi:MAG: anhydro-N-acetylmuramic acid kinase [Crocinitomicaceae bacterium]|nr:anhydro-N-acetylmuramic acid kinase [Crocinitomicaceae bacterium]